MSVGWGKSLYFIPYIHLYSNNSTPVYISIPAENWLEKSNISSFLSALHLVYMLTETTERPIELAAACTVHFTKAQINCKSVFLIQETRNTCGQVECNITSRDNSNTDQPSQKRLLRPNFLVWAGSNQGRHWKAGHEYTLECDTNSHVKRLTQVAWPRRSCSQVSWSYPARQLVRLAEQAGSGAQQEPPPSLHFFFFASSPVPATASLSAGWSS